MKIILTLVSIVTLGLFLISCDSGKKEGSQNQPVQEITSDLTQFELENGIGPIKEKISIGPIEPKLVKRGEDIWNQKCIICHKLDERYIGPALGDVTKRRTPEFIMNTILNPEEMERRHPITKQLLAEYKTPMINQNLSIDDARAILEFLREVGKEK